MAGCDGGCPSSSSAQRNRGHTTADDKKETSASTTASWWADADLPDWVDEFTPLSSTKAASPAASACIPDNPGDGIRIGNNNNIHKQRKSATAGPSERCQPLSSFETLLATNTHASNALLVNLTVLEIANFSLVSRAARGMTRSDGLWQAKFVMRWKVLPAPVWTVKESSIKEEASKLESKRETKDKAWFRGGIAGDGLADSESLWFRSYQNAHRNLHDLWLTHWNCTLPSDGTSSGRCAVPDLRVVPDASLSSEGSAPSTASAASSAGDHGGLDDGYESPIMRKCPTCRHHPLLNSRLEELNDALDAESKFAEEGGSNDRTGRVKSASMARTGDLDPVTKSRTIADAHSLLLRRDLGPWEASADEELASRFAVGTTPAKAVFRSSLYSAAKWARNLRERDSLNITMRSNPSWDARPMDGCKYTGDEEVVESALQSLVHSGVPVESSQFEHMMRSRSISSSCFQAAATCHRRINPDQYRSSGLQFMKDALFFNVDPTHDKVRKDTGWLGGISCPIGKRSMKTTDRGEVRQERSDDEQDMPALERALRDVYGDATIDSNATSLPSDPTPPLPLEPNAPGTLSSRGPQYDNALQSWHVVRLSNPDFVRPITFRIYLQRPDCFTAFPASGFLRPGESCEIVLGVRALGSIIAEAFESIDSGREEIDPLLANIYTREAHLPYAPFAIRYMFAPVSPCIPPGHKVREEKAASFANVRSDLQSSSPLSSSSSSNSSAVGEKSMIDYLWDNFACETDVRTIYVSAHVNANYGFDEFISRTLLPFEITPERTLHQSEALTFLSPNLQQSNPNLFKRLNNIGLETDDSALGKIYRTEKACFCCGRSWGARSEELARAFLLSRMAVDRYARVRNRQVRNSIRCARLIPALVRRALVHNEGGRRPDDDDGDDDDDDEDDGGDDVLPQLYRIGFGLNAILLLQRANKTLTASQRSAVAKYEIFLNDLLLFIQDNSFERPSQVTSGFGGDDGGVGCRRPWRNVGMYRFLRCTDSIYNHTNEVHPQGKEEPAYLETFRNLWHSPGLYRLGAQDDPNHIDEQEIFGTRSSVGSRGSSPKRLQRINWRHADVFKQDAVCAVACAMSMIHAPRSLLLHGVYDRLEPPGTICRRASSWDFEIIFSCPNDAPDLRLARLLTHRCLQEFEGIVSKLPMLGSFGKKSQRRSAFCSRDRILENSLQKTLKSYTILGWKSVSIELNEIDPEGLASLVDGTILCVSYQEQFIQNVPDAGCGRFVLSTIEALPHLPPIDNVRVSPLSFYTPDEINAAAIGATLNVRVSSNRASRPGPTINRQLQGQAGRVQIGDRADNPIDQEGGGVGAPRIINLLWLISFHIGWSVDDDRKPGAHHVERGILIATQWLSNTLMALPLFLTLVARYLMFITPSPLDYHLEGLPYVEAKRMKYLSANECGWAAVIVILLYLVLGRFSERNVCRSFNRAMLEVVPDPRYDERRSPFQKYCSVMLLRCQRIYDSITPHFIQTKTFSPRWNRRNRHDVEKFIIQSKSCDYREHRSFFHAASGTGCGTIDIKSLQLDGSLQPNISFVAKVLIGFLVSVGSFSACSPHFSLNLITSFYSSIALGLSMSLQYMEQGNGSISSRRIFKPMRLNVVIITSFLFGQLVGSSGGILFLAEFVVTTISLLLGGAATISTNAVESWMTFFFMSATSFVGYLFARVALVDNTRNKRGGVPSLLLLLSIVVLSCLTVCTFLFLEWEIPPTALIVRVPTIAL